MIKTAFASLVVFFIFWNNVMAESQVHVENFNGVDITFSPPNMPEQRSFQLRGVLDLRETQILVEAIPTIAKFLNYVRRNDFGFLEKLHQYRTPYQFIDEKPISLAPSRTHKWKITDETIQFETDFIVNYGEVGAGKMGDFLYRDAYLFKKIDGKWLFAENIGAKPYGFLKCKNSDKKCTADVDLW